MQNKINIDINLNNIKNNFLKIASYTKSKCIPVLKANAYNFNVINVINKLLEIEKIENDIFVFCLDEGIKIRKHFKDKLNNIYILSGNLKNEEKIFLENNLTPVINSMPQLINFYEEILRQNKKNINVILQFNTGMNRSGIEMNEIDILKEYLQNKQNHINVEMILSHFACPDNIKDKLTIQQLENIDILSKSFPNVKRSFCATDAIFNLKETNYECVRIGYGLYGGKIANFPEIDLKQALTITCNVYKDKDEYYINIGQNNGLFKNFNKNSYVIIDGKKFYYKKILKNKLIIETQENIKNKTALVIGKFNNNEIFINDFAKFYNSNIQEMYIRLLANYKENGNIYNNKYCKSNLDINNNVINYYESTIIEIRTITKNGWIGYDATKTVNCGDVIASIFNGYADSLPRILSNNYNVLVKTNNDFVKCPIYGRISMDQFTIKIPEKYKNDVKVNCKVIVIDNKSNVFFKKTNFSNCEMLYMLKNSTRTVIK